jgi:SAM-dependent methyltransferase
MFSVDFLNLLRTWEIEEIARRLPAGARVLEIGAGTGRQALELRKRGFEVEAIEIPDSNYTQDRLFPITDYDGRQIPFPDGSFDVVFSSNVLEHVRELEPLQREVRRVLRPGGICLHILPTHAWRFWTILSAFPAGFQEAAALRSELVPRRGPVWPELRRLLGAVGSVFHRIFAPLFPRRHGETGSFFSELWLFHPRRWRKSFRASGFEIVRDEPMGLHYTGNFVFGGHLSQARRARLARWIGSACHVFELRVRP